MPPPPPPELTDEREQALYRDLARLYEDYCGEDEEVWVGRRVSYQKVLRIVDGQLDGATASGKR
jgi:hypothetical protein